MSPVHGFSLARRIRAGETVYSAWSGLAAPIVAELIAREGFAAVTLDQQHGLYDMATTAAAIAAVHQAGAAPIVRIPLGDFAAASRILDFGAEAVIAPMINTATDARMLVAATKYPPLGERSWGPHRASTLTGIADPTQYLLAANDVTLAIAMVETRAAMANLDAILDTPGLDGVFVGPSDLSLALTDGSELDPHSTIVEEGLDRVAAAAARAKKLAGLYCANAERAKACAPRGFRFLAVSSDTAFLRAGAMAALKALG